MSETGTAWPLRRGGRRFGVTALAVTLVASVGLVGAEERARDAAQRGRELARRVVRARNTSGYRIRARVVIGTPSESSPRPTVLQLRLLNRRENRVTRLLFQILWSERSKGHAAVIERGQDPPITGFLFDPPDQVTPLTPARIAEPFAEIPLTLEDLADDFWSWPTQRIDGEGRDGKDKCTILESQPPPSVASAYSRIRSCVDQKRALPRWVEKYAPGDALVKRIAFERQESKNRSGRVRATMIVSDGAGVTQARVEFLSSEQDISIPRSEFSVERLSRLGDRTGLEGRSSPTQD